MHRARVTAVLFAVLAATAPAQRIARDGPAVSPFRGMRMVDKVLQVQVQDDTWYELQSLNGIEGATLLQKAREFEERDWWKRITEDLPALLDAMGHKPGETVDLKLRDLKSGKTVDLAAVPMTAENRQRLQAAGKGGPRPAVVVRAPAVAQPERVARNGPAVSPFRAMQLVDRALQVQVQDDTWYGLEAIDGIDAATLMQRAYELEDRVWWKRITEDLPALLDAMGHKVSSTVDLQLRDLKIGKAVQLTAVEMTHDNRSRLLDANRGRETAFPVATGPLAVADARADLEELRQLLDQRFAYRHLRQVDTGALFTAAARKLTGDTIDREQLAREVDRILRAFGDGHSRLAPGEVQPTAGFLPFLVQRAQGGYVAFREDRTGFVDDDHPFLEAVDGVPLERWHATARMHATPGSPALRERETERMLRNLADLRAELALPAEAAVRITLRGKDSAEATLPVTAHRPQYGVWPRKVTRLLDGNVGYLRLCEMSAGREFLDGIDAAMVSFRSAKGLVVDVRGNGGGTRDALRRLFPYLLEPDGKPQVVNVAAALLAACETDAGGPLADRGLHPVDWPEWSAPQKEAIAACARTFKPEWQPPAKEFSAWQYLVLDRSDNPKAFHFDRPVIVLVDGGCFSATDVFAAALRTRPRVQVVGQPTGGGSGRARRYTLGKSGIGLQLSTMASFRPDGTLLEGRGVVPDIACEPAPGDFVGQGDAVLDRALALLK